MTDKHVLPLAAAVAFSFFVWGVLGVLVGSILPEVVAELSLSSFEAGLIFVVWSFGFAIGSAAAERLLRLAPAHRLLLVLSAATGVAALVQAQAPTFAIFAGLYAALGLFGGAVFTASHTLFGALFPARRTSALGVLDLVFSGGNIVAPLLVVGLVAADASWRVTFVVIGAAFLAGAIAFAFGGRAGVGREAGGATAKPAAAPTAARPRGRDGPPLIALAAGSFGLGATEWSQHVWFVTWALAAGIDGAFARIALAAFTAGMVAARVAAIALGDRMRSALAVRLLLAAALAGHAAMLVAPGEATLLAANVALGMGIGAMLPVFLGLAMDGDPARAATFSAVMVVSLTLGGQVASFTVGTLAELTDVRTAFPAAFGAVAIMAAGFESFRILSAHRRTASAALAAREG
ncbi:MFS transporter [Salinarimonas chemoclinalis]|uniref:MFS transporter n=1 Tax=Salinarimonas chemoclinalis TaxID=3241599 RepID=UPI00355842FC